MHHLITRRIRKPVKRLGAEQYMLAMLVSFAASVTLTRLFLALTGYPQLGGGELHIAHALWGGLLLFIAALLPLIYANRWAYTAGAVLAGTGVGLFIDEVGKFITQNNDYFHPLAAPIIYAVFVMTVMLYLRVRRPPSRTARDELYQALDALEEVLENDLDEREYEDLRARLRYVIDNSERLDQARLAHDLLEFLRAETIEIAPRQMGVMESTLKRWRAFEARRVTRQRMRMMLAGALLGVGLVTLMRTSLPFILFSFGAAAINPNSTAGPLGMLFREALGLGELGTAGVVFRITNLVLEGGVSLLLIVAASLLAFGKDHWATALGWLGLLLSLTAGNLLVFYYDQFVTVITALLQLGLLIGVGYYRSKYLAPELPVKAVEAAG